MRTTVTIPDSTMTELMKYSERKTKTAAVNHAVTDWVRLRKIQRIRALRGKLPIADNISELRALDTAPLDEE